MPDATTLLKFRRLLLDHDLTRALFEEINAHLAERGLLMRAGTIADATIIAAPSSTKNANGERDPEMHQTKKGNQWHFGMKAHIGVDAESGLVHSVVGTAANVNDVTQAGALLHGQETAAFGDAGYRGVDKREEAPGAEVARGHAARQAPGPGQDQRLAEAVGGSRAIEGQRASQGRASVPCREEPVPPPQGSLPGAGEEPGTAVRAVRPGQPRHREEVTAGRPGRRCVLSAPGGGKEAAKRPRHGVQRALRRSQAVFAARCFNETTLMSHAGGLSGH